MDGNPKRRHGGQPDRSSLRGQSSHTTPLTTTDSAETVSTHPVLFTVLFIRHVKTDVLGSAQLGGRAARCVTDDAEDHRTDDAGLRHGKGPQKRR